MTEYFKDFGKGTYKDLIQTDKETEGYRAMSIIELDYVHRKGIKEFDNTAVWSSSPHADHAYFAWFGFFSTGRAYSYCSRSFKKLILLVVSNTSPYFESISLKHLKDYQKYGILPEGHPDPEETFKDFPKGDNNEY